MTPIHFIQECGFVAINLLNLIRLKIRKVEFGTQLQIRGGLFIRGKGKITIGNNVTINSCRSANPIGGATKTILFAKENGRISIGNNCGLSNSAIVALEKIQIDDDVFIGGNCKIYDHDFHSLYYQERMKPGNQGVLRKPVHIKKGAFIGAHSIILKGVTIGECSVVGAGSVVTKCIPNYEIWAGNPARFIRKIKREDELNEGDH